MLPVEDVPMRRNGLAHDTARQRHERGLPEPNLGRMAQGGTVTRPVILALVVALLAAPLAVVHPAQGELADLVDQAAGTGAAACVGSCERRPRHPDGLDLRGWRLLQGDRSPVSDWWSCTTE